MKRELTYVHVKKSQSATDVSVLKKTEDDFDYKHLEKESTAGELMEEIAEAQQLLQACETLSTALEPEKQEKEESRELPAAIHR